MLRIKADKSVSIRSQSAKSASFAKLKKHPTTMKQNNRYRKQLLAIIFFLLKKKLITEDVTKDSSKLDVEKSDFKRIRCPLCKWQPRESSRWYCGDCDYPEFFFDGCGASWNTFATHGVCPQCKHQWRWTSCLYCGEWSLHKDWYETDNS